MRAGHPEGGGHGRPRWIGHVAATVVVVLAGAMPTHPGDSPSWSGRVLALNLLAAAVLVGRHRLPRPVLAVEVALVVVSVPVDLFNPGTVVAAAVATFTLTLGAGRRTGAVTTIAVAATMLGCALVAGDTAPQYVLVILLGGAIGDAIRAQRAALAAVTERAERAERTREALARQRVAEDRLATARDLHDVVAHQIAVINLHAGVASSALRTRPHDAEASLAVIRKASRTVLSEIGDLLATLRDPDAVDTGPPGLAQLDDVVRSFASSGLDVTVRTHGQPVELPSAVDVTALRVVQEALTNAHKHGAEHRAHVLLEYLPRTLRVTVTNPVRPEARGPAGVGTRQGLLGMAERVESVRGTLTHGPSGVGTWALAVDLPLTTRPDQLAPAEEHA